MIIKMPNQEYQRKNLYYYDSEEIRWRLYVILQKIKVLIVLRLQQKCVWISSYASTKVLIFDIP